MVTYTKREFKKKAEELANKIYYLRCELGDLQSDLEDAIDEIEPYEGNDDLTDTQQDRKDWLEEQRDYVGRAIDHLSDAESNLDF